MLHLKRPKRTTKKAKTLQAQDKLVPLTKDSVIVFDKLILLSPFNRKLLRVFSASLRSCRNGLVFGDAGATASGSELAINFVNQEGVGIEIAADAVRQFLMCLFITAQTHGARSLSNIAQLAPRGGIIDAELPPDHANHGAGNRRVAVFACDGPDSVHQ